MYKPSGFPRDASPAITGDRRLRDSSVVLHLCSIRFPDYFLHRFPDYLIILERGDATAIGITFRVERRNAETRAEADPFCVRILREFCRGGDKYGMLSKCARGGRSRGCKLVAPEENDAIQIDRGIRSWIRALVQARYRLCLP